MRSSASVVLHALGIPVLLAALAAPAAAQMPPADSTATPRDSVSAADRGRMTTLAKEAGNQAALASSHVVAGSTAAEALAQVETAAGTAWQRFFNAEAQDGPIRRKFLALDPAFAAIETAYGMGYRWLA